MSKFLNCFLNHGQSRTASLFLLATVFLSVALTPNTGRAQPANDNFLAAEVITGEFGTVTGSNVGATEEPNEPKHWQQISRGASVWYQWVAPSNSVYTFDTIGSDFDTILAVYFGQSLVTLQQVAVNDDTTGLGLLSRVKITAAEGTTYWIVVDGYDYGTGARQGNITLNWYKGAPPDQTGPLGGEFNFASPVFFTTENETFRSPYVFPVFPPSPLQRSIRGALVTVTRTGLPSGKVLVDYSTIDTNILECGDTNTFDAIPTCDYIPTSGTLAFDEFQMSKSFVVPILQDGFPEARRLPKLFYVQLFNPRPDPEEEANNPGLIVPSIGVQSNAPIVLIHFNDGWFTTVGTNRGVTLTNFNIERTTYAVDERAGSINIDIILTGFGNPGGDVDVNVVGVNFKPYFLLPGSDYADPFARLLPNTPYTDGTTNFSSVVDFTTFTTRVTFGANQSRRTVAIPIFDDDVVEFNEDILVFLTPVPASPPVGPNGVANVTILYDEQPAGAADREWNPDFVRSTTPRENASPGANNVVRAVAVQANQQTLIGGDFTAYNAFPRSRIARINFDGSIDLGFVPGTGADEFVSSIVVYPPFTAQADKIVIGGGFTSYNNVQRNGVARLNSNGSLDTSFNPGSGANGPVRALALQSDGKVLIAGEFTVVNSLVRNGVARLNPDGSVDATFDPGAGPDGPVYALALGSNGEVYIGGDFLMIGSEFRPRVARLNSNGSLDTTYDSGGGADGPVHALALTPSEQLIVGGAFRTFDFRIRGNLARLDSTGALDTTYDPGDGANDSIYSLVQLPGGKLLAGGRFTSFNGTRRVGLTRLFSNGTVDTSFLDTGYNQFAGLIKTFNFQNNNYVNAIAVQLNGDVMIGGSFTNIGCNQAAELNFRIPPALVGDVWNVWTRADKRSRYNVARLVGGYTLGPGNASLVYSQNTVNENNGRLSLPLQRFDGNLGTLGATVTSSNGVALGGLDFGGVCGDVSWIEDNFLAFPISAGATGELLFPVPMFDDFNVEGDELFNLKLIHPNGSISLGGEIIPLGGALGTSLSTVTIADNDFNHGDLVFSTPVTTTNENRVYARLTVIRTNGTSGNVSVRYFTRDGDPSIGTAATNNVDYIASSGSLTFDSGETSKSFTIQLIDDFFAEPDKHFFVILTNATGGATIPPGRTPVSTMTNIVRIIDNDIASGRANFLLSSITPTPTTAIYQTNENAGAAIIPLERLGGDIGELTVTVMAFSGSATAGVDFIGVTNTVTWTHHDATPKFITIPLIDDLNVEPLETVNLRILNPSIVNGVGTTSNATLRILDDDMQGFVSFSQPFYDADERGTNIWITVVREGGRGGTNRVNYAVFGQTAIANQDFIVANGTLTFGPGVTSTNFVITIINNTNQNLQFGGELTANMTLTAVPGQGAVGNLPTATLRIYDDEFRGDPAGSLDPTFNALTGSDDAINAIALEPDGDLLVGGAFRLFNRVSRTRLARVHSDGSIDALFDTHQGPNGTVSAILLQPDGRVVIGGQFTQVAGTNRNFIARLLPDGTLDSFFNPGAGLDSPVTALAWLTDGGIVAGGAFASANGFSRHGVAIFNSNGTVRATFDPGFGVAGTVLALAVQLDGKILIGGNFMDVAGFTVPFIARLNANGTLDGSFSTGSGPNGPVRSILIEPGGGIVIGGSFTSVNGQPRGRMARLSENGTLDPLFLGAVEGADADVTSIALQFDGKYVVGGAFTRFNSVTRSRITRLNQNGKTDSSINFGLGANDLINALAIQPDRRIFLAGRFTSYDGEPRAHLARIHGGSIAGPGTFQFTTPLYQVDENAGAATISVLRRGGLSTDVTVNYSSAAGTATPDADYTNVVGTLQFPEGEVLATFAVPIVPDNLGEPPETVTLSLSGPTGGATIGDIPNASLLIFSDDSGIGFSTSTYNVSEAAAGGQVLITVVRVGATNELAQVAYRTTSGTATAGSDYTPVSGILTFVPGQTSRTFTVPIIDDDTIESTESFGLSLSNVSSTATLMLSTATVNIIDNEFGPGVLAFSSPAYSVDETNGSVNVIVRRTRGVTGVVSVDYQAFPTTASTNDFVPRRGTLNFVDGQSSNVISITILDDLLVEPTEDFIVVLSNPTGGATIGPVASTSVSILDSDISQIIAAGSVLVSESLTNNGIIDPGETVTVALGLRNQGSGNTANLIGTLLTGGGVVNPSGAQTYGILVAGGGAVSQNYTFTASGTSGDRILATLLVTDSGITNGFVTFGFTIGGQAARNFGSTNGVIQIRDNDPALPYPASIIVDNLGGLITRVSVTLSNFSHTFPDDVDILLVGPGGQKVTLMSDVGGNVPASNVTLTFADNATNTLPDSGQLFTRTYQPANYAGQGTADLFPLPAPAIPYTNTSLAVLNGAIPNGLWNLFIVDDGVGDVGSISGWSLRIETTDPVGAAAAANLALAAFSPTPVLVGSEFPYMFTVTNKGPATAQNVVLLNQLPSGVSFVRASTTVGRLDMFGQTMRWNIGSVSNGTRATVSMIAKADAPGTFVNQVGVASSQVDLNPSDNGATVLTSVIDMPVLSVSHLNGSIRVSWPAVDGFQLQGSPTLAPTDWSNVNQAPQIISGAKVVILPADAPSRFFRLRSQ